MFPSNVLILLPHVSYFIPNDLYDNLEDNFKINDHRLLKNFSDWGTRFLISDKIPTEQVIYAEFSRAIWDPNRARDRFDIFRETDFGWQKLWKSPLLDTTKDMLLQKYYDTYHQKIANKISEMKKLHNTIFIIDIHDTWNILMSPHLEGDKLKDFLFPQLALCDSEWLTLEPEHNQTIHRIFEKNLKLPILRNDPYKSSFTSLHYWNKDKWVFTLQVEFGRYLLIDEKTQTYLPSSETLKNGLYQTLVEIWNYMK
jgi:N-formylglutamate amidohydrolase